MRDTSFAVGVCTAIAVVAIAGCGTGASSKTAHLRGKITIGGQPLPAEAVGSLNFRPTGAGQANTESAVIKKDGTYDAHEVPKGKVKVWFDIQQPTGEMVQDGGAGTPYEKYRSLVPEEFGMGLDLQVDGDNLQQDFPL